MNSSRYIRQILLDDWSETKQKQLANSRVAIIGCGGLGSVVAPYLAGAGVGTIILVDRDTTHLSNLHRQVFYSSLSKGQSKAKLLKEHLDKLNPEVKTIIFQEYLSKDNIEEILSNVDLVVECTDDIFTKYLVNDYCHINGIPMIYGGIHKYSGQVAFFQNDSKKSIHLRDIFPEIDEDLPSCSQVGVLGTIAGIIGMFQANEAIKYLVNIGNSLHNKLLIYHALTCEQSMITLAKTYELELENVYNLETYNNNLDCITNTLTWDYILSHINKFEIVSLLEDNEKGIDTEYANIQIPYSTFDVDTFDVKSDKKIAFVCMKGQRSKLVIKELQNKYPSKQYFDIKGGYHHLILDKKILTKEQ